MVTDQVENGNITIKYCPIDDMIGDFMRKGLQGIKFAKFARLLWDISFNCRNDRGDCT